MAAHFGKRLRRGAATTAVAAAAVAALTASQASGVTTDDQGRLTSGAQPTPDAGGNGDDGGTATGNSGYFTDLPPLNSPTESPGTTTDPTTGGSGSPGASEAGIPATVLDAYKKAADELQRSKPGCNLPWQLLAAIGKVESGHARGGRVDANGKTLSPILGPELDGSSGFARILNHDGTYARAIGPMQFLSTTWDWAGRDGNGDGVKDPNNIYDAALAAGHYLCRLDRDMSVRSGMDAAILSYNNSRDYLNTVLSWYEYYRKGSHSIPDGTGSLPSHRSDDHSGVGPTPTPTPRETTQPKPTKPAPHKPGGGDHTGSGSTPSTPPADPTPPSKPTPPSTPPATPAPTPTDTVDHLADSGTGTLSAMTGDTFDQKVAVKAVTTAGKAVPKVRVRFTITGDTDAAFTGGETVATVVTDSSGKATAPALVAGTKTGTFTVRALVVGRLVPGVDYTATVTERQADTLTPTSGTELTATPGGEFATQVGVKATYQGAAARGVTATATVVTSVLDPTANDKGPYFKDASGKAVRTLTGLETDANGRIELPKLYADDTTGTFLLRIELAGGKTLTVELTVAEAAS
ncbi:lytic transglycosylase [Streptomyces sp. RY43-2]|uniref:Lytic transglycosylase n=1 Tax=Streptomyces macrolidinus TaxID=2952607 RepID=A0ABT0Z7H2_9ACTN|nr:lytic transglycosylase [Streptomyces macrolidinus]MCN9239713.1 lytic transglycosylase [Streptomyces macrolidinus]